MDEAAASASSLLQTSHLLLRRDVARTLREISTCSIAHPQPQPTERHYYCGQLHELDQIALLERRRGEEIPEEVLP